MADEMLADVTMGIPNMFVVGAALTILFERFSLNIISILKN